MNMRLKNRIARISGPPSSKEERIELKRDILSAKFLSEIQIHLESRNHNRAWFAKRMDISESFISQLFSADKSVSMEFLAKAEEELGIEFQIGSDKKFSQSYDQQKYREVLELMESTKTPQLHAGFWVFVNTRPDYVQAPESTKIFKSDAA